MSYELRIIRRVFDMGESSKHYINVIAGSDKDIKLYVHDKRVGQAVVDSFYTDEHKDERDVFLWLNDWAEAIREEREQDVINGH